MHIDDLRDTEDMSLDLSAFCGASMSELMSQSLSNSGRPIVPLFKLQCKLFSKQIMIVFKHYGDQYSSIVANSDFHSAAPKHSSQLVHRPLKTIFRTPVSRPF